MKRENRPVKILAVKPGTRLMAVAVFDGPDLVYWKNKRVRDGKMSEAQAARKVKEVLGRLVDYWQPTVLALEDIYYAQSKASRTLRVIREVISNFGRDRKLKVCFYCPLSVREFICRDRKPNKLNAAGVIADRHYPWLRANYEKEERKKWYEEKAGLRIFDAVAVGFYCLHELEKAGKIKINKNHANTKETR